MKAISILDLKQRLASLAAVRAGIVEERDLPDGSVERRPLPAADRIAALEAIKEPCAVRMGRQPGSRAHLDFGREFLKDVGRSP